MRALVKDCKLSTHFESNSAALVTGWARVSIGLAPGLHFGAQCSMACSGSGTAGGRG